MALGESIFSGRSGGNRGGSGAQAYGLDGNGPQRQSPLASRRVLSTIAAVSVAVAVVAIGFSVVARNDAQALRDRVTSESVDVVRVRSEVLSGQELTRDKLELVRVADGVVPADAISSIDDAVNKIAAHDIASGGMVTKTEIRDTLADATEYTLKIPEGKVAASVTVGGMTHAPSLLSVGDHVNISCFGQGEGAMIAEDVPVLAIDGDTHARSKNEYSRVQLALSPDQLQVMSSISDSVRLTQCQAAEEALAETADNGGEGGK